MWNAPSSHRRGALLGAQAAAGGDGDGPGAGESGGGASSPAVTDLSPPKPSTPRQVEGAGGEVSRNGEASAKTATNPLVSVKTAKMTGGSGVARPKPKSWSPSSSADDLTELRTTAITSLQLNVQSALSLLRSTVKVGEAARESLNDAINNTPGVAVRGLVTGVLTDIAGQPVTVENIRLYPDGVALENLAIGDQLKVDKLVVRARLQPLLAVLSSWKSTPANMSAPPILIESIRLKGIKSVETDFTGIRRAFNLYVHAPGAIIIRSLKMYDISAAIVVHPWPASYKAPAGYAPVAKVLRLASMELENVDSRKPINKLAGCMVGVDEGDGKGGTASTGRGEKEADYLEAQVMEGLSRNVKQAVALAARMESTTQAVGGKGNSEAGAGTRAGAGAGASAGADVWRGATVERQGGTPWGQRGDVGPRSPPPGPPALVPAPAKRPAANRDPFAGFRSFVPAAVMSQVDRAVSPTVVALANTSQAVFESLAPVIAADLGRVLAVDVAEFAGVDALLDVGIIAALMTAGLPRRFLANGGGAPPSHSPLHPPAMYISFPQRVIESSTQPTQPASVTVRHCTSLYCAPPHSHASPTPLAPRPSPLPLGGALLVKLIESGVAVVLLERADLLKVMVERRLLERMLDLDLMSPMLDRPELTKEMFRSGVVKGVMSNGVLEALLAAGKEDVVVSTRNP